jgi:quercetin dioxygenase-like cupin family protein
MLSWSPAHAARRSDSGPAGRRRSSAPTRRLKARICDLDTTSPGPSPMPTEPIMPTRVYHRGMLLTRNGTETGGGPADWFTGVVLIDAVASPTGASRISASSVHFTPGARTAWHTHPNGQTIYVTEGVGLAQRRGGPIEVIRPGDRVFFEPGEEHWHGATATRFMTHIAMLEVDGEGSPATWGDHVTDEEYAAAPPIDP